MESISQRPPRLIDVAIALCLVFACGCGGLLGGILPHKEKALIVATSDSDWQVTRNSALIVAQDQCLDQLVRALFANVSFSAGRVALLSDGPVGPGLTIRYSEVADLYYALGALFNKVPSDQNWKRLSYVSQFEVERYKYRVEVSMDYTETEIRSVLRRLYPSVSGELPSAAERRILDLRGRTPREGDGKDVDLGFGEASGRNSCRESWE